jgi:AGCS family alanine or glycine:cation symporter
LEIFNKFVDLVDSYCWNPITLLFIFLSGVYLSYRIGFFQFFQSKLWISRTFGIFFKKNKKQSNSISPIQAASAALGGCVGTANIVGVAGALTIGGAGSMFWMWISSFFGMATAFSENTLGIIYRKKDKNGNYIGGPMFYIQYGLKKKWLAKCFAIFCVGFGLGTSNMMQTNSLSEAIGTLIYGESFSSAKGNIFNEKGFLNGLVIAIIAGIVIFGGIKRIVKVTDKIVPIMAVIYILAGLLIIFSNVEKIVPVFLNILSEAFNFKSVGGAVFGSMIVKSIKSGLSRGILSNEAGLGSGPILHSASSNSEPVIAGMWGIFQVFVDTFLICNITGFVILTTGAINVDKSFDGRAITDRAFGSFFGDFGGVLVNIMLALFAFSTLIGWSYCPESCANYLKGKKAVRLYRISHVLLMPISASLPIDIVWKFLSLFCVAMTIPNLISVLFLSKEVKGAVDNFLIRIKSKKLNLDKKTITTEKNLKSY